MLLDEPTQSLPIRQIIRRGVVAAHGVLLGALLLFLLHAPAQVLSAVAQGYQAAWIAGPAEQPEAKEAILYMAMAFGGFLFAVGVFFLFPLILGAILGQVRDRLEYPLESPGRFGRYGRKYYLRLLGSQGLFTLVMLGIMLPMMFVGMILAFQQVAGAMPGGLGGAGADPQPLTTPQLTRALFSNPVMLVSMAISSLLMTAVAVVYWIANCIVVSEHESVLASWRQSLRFCRQNFAVVLVAGLMFFGVGLLISPLSLVGQLGIVTNPWILGAMALVYAALIGYSASLLAGLSMSLYLGRRLPSEVQEPEMAAMV